MPLKAVVESLEGIDAGLHSQYKEVAGADGKKSYHLDVEGVEMLPPVRTLKDEAARRRIAERDATTKLSAYTSAFGDKKVDEILAVLDRVPELEAAVAAGGDPKKLEGIVEARLSGKLAPLQRDLQKAQTELAERDKALSAYQAKERTRNLQDAVRGVVKGLTGFQEHAIEDAFMLAERVFEQNEDGSFSAKEGMGVTPGSDIAGWLTEMQAKRPHWWGPTQGAGAQGNRGGAGGNGANPWAKGSWNLTEQGNVIRQDRKRAEALAAAAGSRIGATRPAG